MILRQVGLLALIAGGCESDEIQSYRVPKEAASAPVAAVSVQRMMAAVIPHGEKVWFVKLAGPGAEVERQKAAFNDLIRSIRFEENRMRWTTPSGWQEKPGEGLRFASFSAGTLEATVIPLGREAGDLLPNVNRWREQMGLRPVSETELSRFLTPAVTQSGLATLVELSAPEASASEPAPAAAGSGLRYVAPEGWRENPAQGMRVASFEADGCGVSVIPLSGESGDLLANVNRWRGQVGLGPVDAQAMEQAAVKTRIAGEAATCVDLAGVEQRILGAVLPRGDKTWFFKLQGPVEAAGRQKPAFEAFLRSVKFE